MLGVRTLDSIPGVLANYLSLLPSGWVVHFLHGARNAEAVLSSQTLQHALAKGSLRLRRLEEVAEQAWIDQACKKHIVTPGKNQLEARILTSPRFWSAFSAPHLMLVHPDSALCPRPTWAIEDFYSYAFVGAPWYACAMPVSCVGNHGMSMWSRELMLWITSKYGRRRPMTGSESNFDIWASKTLQNVSLSRLPGPTPDSDGGSIGSVLIPTVKVASMFSVESLLTYRGNYTPIGIHRPWAAPGHNLREAALLEILRRCPAAEVLNRSRSTDESRLSC
tara:strand:- start:15 stop:848 length:834 start_codon:yes stop_codon:yes gene_type:complete